MNTAPIEDIQKKIKDYKRKYYESTLMKGGLLLLTFSLLLYLFFVLIEYFFYLDTFVKGGFLVSYLIFFSVGLYQWIISPLWKMVDTKKGISDLQVGKAVEEKLPNVGDRLINLLQLSNSNVSGDLLQASISQKAKEIGPYNLSELIDFKENVRYLRFFFIPFVLVLGFVVLNPDVLKSGTSRLIDYNTKYTPPAPFSFMFINKDDAVEKYTDVELKMKIQGDEIPAEVYIELDGVKHRMRKNKGAEFSYLLKNINSKKKVRFEAGGFYSKEFHVDVFSKPVIMGMNVKVVPPRYTGRSAETFQDNGSFTIAEGSTVTWEFKSRDVDEMSVAFGKEVSKIEEGALEKMIKNSTNYSLLFENNQFKITDSLQYHIDVIKDEFPAIEVSHLQDSLNPTANFFNGIIKDDYGFTRLKILIKKDGKVVKSEQIPIDRTSVQFDFNYFLDLKEYEEGVKCEFVVWDNDKVNGYKRKASRSIEVKIPDTKELRKNAENRKEGVKNSMSETLQKVQDLRKEYDDIIKDLKTKKNLDWKDKEKIRDLLKEQEQLQKEIDDIKKANNEIEKLEENLDKNEDILEKQKEINDLFDKIMPEELKEMYKELQEMLDKMDKNNVEEFLEQMDKSNEDLEKELDRNLEFLKQMQFENKLQEIAEDLDKLMEEQKDLKEQGENSDKSENEQLKEQQEELNKQFEDLEKEIEKLDEMNENLDNKRQVNDTKETREQIKQEMNKAGENLDKGKKKKAGENQSQAQQKMEDLKKQIGQMQQQQAESLQLDVKSLRQILDNLVKVSFDQEEIAGELKGTALFGAKYNELAKDQFELRDNLELIEDSLFALSKRLVQIEGIVNKEIGDINYEMKKVIELMEDRNVGMVKNRQQLIMENINDLALLLDEVLKQLQNQMKNQMMSQGSCSKPNQSSQPSFGNLKQMQQKLNQQMKQMMEQMRQGNQGKPQKEGGKKGKGGDGKQMNEQIAKMAAQQSEIRNQLKKLKEQLGSDKKGKQLRDGIDGMSRQMEEIEHKLFKKQFDAELLKRQKEIITRLLESEKAERNQGEEKERKSDENQKEFDLNKRKLEMYEKMKKEENEELQYEQPKLKNFYKQKVNEYFNNFVE